MLATISRAQQSKVSLRQLLFAIVLSGALYVIAFRLIASANLPLWLDETWSAMIATRGSWSAFWREAWLDCNPPLYYFFLAIWTNLFGESNLMLRLPSSLFTIAAALLPVVWRPASLNRAAAWTFGGLILLWQPGLEVMLDARGYGLMLLLSTASCLVVVRTVEQLTLRHAAMWVALGTMMFLTHYYAAVLIIGQAVVLLYRHGVRLLHVWPAAFIATPGLAWFACHLPRLKEYARPDVAWYDPTTAGSAFGHLLYITGATNFASLGAVAAIGIAALLHHKRAPSGDTVSFSPDVKNLALTAAAGGIGFSLAIVIGVVQASLAHRYFIPLVPSAMLAITCVAQKCGRQEIAGLMLAYGFLLPDLNGQLAKEILNGRAIYGYEKTSDFVQAYKPDQLLFLWDHPATKIMDQRSLEDIGGYFMRRAGGDVPVHALVVPLNADPNEALRAAIDSERPALIWLYDTAHQSAARIHPSKFESDPAWTCRRWTRKTIRSGELGSIACVRLGAARD